MATIKEQIDAIRTQLDLADQGDRNQIGHILIALSLLTDVVEKLAAKEQSQ